LTLKLTFGVDVLCSLLGGCHSCSGAGSRVIALSQLEVKAPCYANKASGRDSRLLGLLGLRSWFQAGCRGEKGGGWGLME
jgi:hypothetical protein